MRMNPALYFLLSLSSVSAYANAVAGPSAPTPTDSAPKSSLCAHPAKLEGHLDARAPDLGIILRHGFDPAETAHALAQKYHFRISAIFTTAFRGFFIKGIDVAIIPRLRCEPSIDTLSFDIPTSTTGARSEAHLTLAWSGP